MPRLAILAGLVQSPFAATGTTYAIVVLPGSGFVHYNNGYFEIASDGSLSMWDLLDLPAGVKAFYPHGTWVRAHRVPGPANADRPVYEEIRAG